MTFEEACRLVEAVLESRWKSAEETERMMRLEKEKRAIMGFEEDMDEYRHDIGQIICEEGIENVEFPPWYRTLADGVFN